MMWPSQGCAVCRPASADALWLVELSSDVVLKQRGQVGVQSAMCDSNRLRVKQQLPSWLLGGGVRGVALCGLGPSRSGCCRCC